MSARRRPVHARKRVRAIFDRPRPKTHQRPEVLAFRKSNRLARSQILRLSDIDVDQRTLVNLSAVFHLNYWAVFVAVSWQRAQIISLPSADVGRATVV